MAMPSTKLPSYVTLDPRSQWHVSALFSTALESMTLPSRLKKSRETLDQIANAMNVNGNQNIAKLRMSISREKEVSEDERPSRLEVRAQSRDVRIPSQNRSDNYAVQDSEDPSVFDIDFFPADAIEHVRGRQAAKKAHVFGQAEIYRGEKEQQNYEANEGDEGQDRARRRAAGLPIIQR